MIGNRYVFSRGEKGLGWVVIGQSEVTVVQKDMFQPGYTISLNTIDDVGGVDKLNDECAMLSFIAENISCSQSISSSDLKKVSLAPGEYHPRIWRGYKGNPFIDQFDALKPDKVYGQKFMGAIVASESLFKEVSEVFRQIEPDQANYQVYGHRLRELLILLCTEVEANWKAVFELNFPSRIGRRLNTADYFLVNAPLFLDGYKVRLKDYPHCVFEPFKGWSASSPTSSLPWYDAYNAVKHDGQSSFSRATLENVLLASAALHVLQISQWGPNIYDLIMYNRYGIYLVDEYPRIPIEDVYYPVESTESDFVSPRAFETL